MNKRIATIMLVLVASMVGTTVLAQSGDRQGKHGGREGTAGHFSERMADRLELDETQRQAVENIQLAAEPEIIALRERKQANREKMKALDPNDPNRSALLNDIAVEQGQLATESTLLFDRVRTELSAVLTEEQRAKAEEFAGRKGKQGKRRRGK